MNGISAPLKEAPGRLRRAFHPVKTQQEGTVHEPGGGLSLECDHAGTLLLDFQPPEV